MGYQCELSAGQSVYLENLHDQTLVTLVSSSPGQQQQSSGGFQTGNWTAPPDVFRSAMGFTIQLHTAQGDRFLYVQGGSLRMLNETPVLADAQPLQVQQVAHLPTVSTPTMSPMPAMPPLPPMQPMTMGTMKLDREAMSMQMGNMRMSMHSSDHSNANPSVTSDPEATGTVDESRNFCSQCGVAIKPSDRFCAHCGHRLA